MQWCPKADPQTRPVPFLVKQDVLRRQNRQFSPADQCCLPVNWHLRQNICNLKISVTETSKSSVRTQWQQEGFSHTERRIQNPSIHDPFQSGKHIRAKIRTTNVIPVLVRPIHYFTSALKLSDGAKLNCCAMLKINVIL